MSERPVLQFRVHPNFYKKLKAAARASKTSIASEASRRLELSFPTRDQQTVIDFVNFIDPDTIVGRRGKRRRKRRVAKAPEAAS